MKGHVDASGAAEQRKDGPQKSPTRKHISVWLDCHDTLHMLDPHAAALNGNPTCRILREDGVAADMTISSRYVHLEVPAMAPPALHFRTSLPRCCWLVYEGVRRLPACWRLTMVERRVSARLACRGCLLVLATAVGCQAFFVAPCSLQQQARPRATGRQHKTKARAGLSMIIPPAE